MIEELNVDANSPAVHTHLTIVQAVIARMAEGSRSSKTWCVIVVSAILVLGAAGMTSFDHLWIAYVPLALFLGLDMYYLALEQRFRESYNTFLEKLRRRRCRCCRPVRGKACGIAPSRHGLRPWPRACSIWPFYLVLAASVIAFVWWRHNPVPKLAAGNAGACLQLSGNYPSYSM